jgi:phosphoribosyl 1,2-cyclic phosphodiesterase
LSAIILSHKHLDHSGDINIMIEAMTESGRKRQGIVFAPRDALDNDPVILNYLRNFPEDIRLLSEGGLYSLDNVSFQTPVRHQHRVETYGFVFETPSHTFSWIVDTKYFAELPRYYRGELVVINVVRLKPDLPIDHLSLPEVRQIIEAIKPKAAILTHFGMTIWRAKPWELAKQITDETGITVIAARDGMKFDLAQLDEK